MFSVRFWSLFVEPLVAALRAAAVGLAAKAGFSGTAGSVLDAAVVGLPLVLAELGGVSACVGDGDNRPFGDRTSLDERDPRAYFSSNIFTWPPPGLCLTFCSEPMREPTCQFNFCVSTLTFPPPIVSEKQCEDERRW